MPKVDLHSAPSKYLEHKVSSKSDQDVVLGPALPKYSV